MPPRKRRTIIPARRAHRRIHIAANPRISIIRMEVGRFARTR